MSNPKSIRVTALAALALAALAAPPAAFAQGTFNLGTGTSLNCDIGNSGASVTSKDCTNGNGASVTLTAWGYGGTAANGNAITGWTQGQITDWNSSGVGAKTGSNETTTDSQHAFDNVTSGCVTSGVSAGCGGSIEALLLSFQQLVSLTKVGIGWFSGDADLSVYAWTNAASAPTSASTMPTVNTAGNGSLVGWTLVAQQDMDSLAAPQQGSLVRTLDIANSPTSSYFLITTYFGATKIDGSWNAADRFKINTFTVACQTANCTPSQGSGVPEPASLALASLGLVAAFGVRRRGQRRPG